MHRVLLATLLVANIAHADPHRFGIELHVAQDAGADVATQEWVDAQLAAANRHFANAEIQFEIAGTEPLAAVHVVTRADRDAFAAAKGALDGGVVHVYLVASLEDVDVPREMRNGVAWRVKGDSRKYVILSAQAKPQTLAHELGHVFGLPHSTEAISIMNKMPRAEPPPEQRTFSTKELATIRRTAARLVKARALVDQ